MPTDYEVSGDKTMTQAPEATAKRDLKIRTEVQARAAAPASSPIALAISAMNVAYGPKAVLHDVALDIEESRVTAFIGPSGCGKSTLLRCLNRMNDLIEDAQITGSVKIKGLDIYAPGTDVIRLRRRVGMVFQKSNP